MQWTTGDSSGGTNGLGGIPAQAGFNAGDGTRFHSLTLSQTDEIVNIDQLQGNSQEVGLWVFRVDQEAVDSGQCTNDGELMSLMSVISPKQHVQYN